MILAALQAGPAVQQAPPVPPRLVVFLAIDQLRPDYLDRWRSEFRGGLALLLREGVVYVNGEQDHAMTATAAGHSTMLSGRSPASTGIIANELGVPDPTSPLIGSADIGASPARFRGTTLADWLVGRRVASRVLSVSRKDRGAILPIGRMKTQVYWYSRGRFTTSRYYADSLPQWVVAWNAREPAVRLAGRPWELSRSADSYPELDNRPFEHGGTTNTFPHLLSTDPAVAAVELQTHTLMDSLTLDIAWAGVRANGLGRDDAPDLLAISLSATDDIGHRFGPSSREVHDHLLNVDRWLGAFFDSLATIVPLDAVVMALTSDHGVTEFPEAGTGGRVSIGAETRVLNAALRDRFGIAPTAAAYSGLLMAPVAALRRKGVDIDSLANAVAARVMLLPGVRAVYTPKTLRASGSSDVEAGRWKRQLPQDTEWIVAVSLHTGWVWGSSATQTGHGTTNLDDRRVPIIIRAPGTSPRRVTRVVRTIDIAPTLAWILNLRPSEPLEGVVLSEFSSHRSPR